jgi:hypothetical protein
LIIAISCLLILAGFFCSGVHAQTADASGFSHMQSALLPVVSGLTVPLSPPPAATYDEQLGMTFTQSFTSLAYSVTAVPQTDSNGYGPAYLLNGLSNDGYWYQVGLSYNWPHASGGYNPGFNFNYEVFKSSKTSIYPTNGGGGLESFSSPVNSGDLVLLSITFNSGNVSMYAKDWNTRAFANATYADSKTSSFTGSLSSPNNSNGFFTGLMTEWYHVNPYTGDEAQVTYSNYTVGLSSAWMWMDEWAPSNPTWSGEWSHSTAAPVTYSPNPTQLHFLSYNGATEYSSAYQFITGSIVQQMTSITLLPAGGSTPLSDTNEFAVSFTLDSQPQVSYAQNGTLTFTADNGTNVVISGVSTGSTSTEEGVLNSQGTNVTVPTGSTTTFYYYDILSQQVAYAISGGGNPASPILTYYTAPSAASAQFNQTINTIFLPLSQQTIMALRGTSAFVNTPILGTAQEQWATPTSFWNISQANQIPTLIIYYHQYQVTAGCSTSDGSVPSSNIILSGTQYGSNYQLPLTTTNQAIWLDANTPWSTSTIATAISGNEQWSSSAGTSGNITGAITINPSYVHQYYLAIISTYGSSSGSGWYNSGATAYAGLSSGTGSDGIGTQYVFNGWTGGASGSNYVQSNGITMNAPITATASWITQYYLTVNSAYGTPAGQGWYNSGASESFNISAPVGSAGVQYVFSSWSGSGSGSYSGSSASSSVTMDAPITETASWITQYYLTVNSAYGTPSGSGWYNAGADITFSVSSPVPESIISQHVCTGWTGTGSAPATGTDASLHFTINQPSSITWNWQSQFTWSTVSLMMGAPLVTAIIGLSIYPLRNSQKLRKRKMMLRAYLLVARAAFPTSHAQEETTALDLIIIKLKITASFIVYKHK